MQNAAYRMLHAASSEMEATICHQLPAFDSAAKGLVRYVIKNEISECDMNVRERLKKLLLLQSSCNWRRRELKAVVSSENKYKYEMQMKINFHAQVKMANNFYKLWGRRQTKTESQLLRATLIKGF